MAAGRARVTANFHDFRQVACTGRSLVGIPINMRSTLASLAFALLAVGCGGSTESTPATTADSGSADVEADTATVDAPKEAASDSAGDAACDLGTVPTVAPFTAEFVFVDADAGTTFPTPSGGDPKGEWRYSKITVYLSPGAKSVLDVSKSSVEGWGFSSYGDTAFRNATDQKLTLETTVVGTVKRGTTTKAKGTWKMEGNDIVYTPECVESSGDAPVPKIGWSRLAADKARMQFKPAPTGMGDFTQQIVIDLELIK